MTFLIQSLCHAWLCNPMDCSTPGYPVLHYLPEFDQKWSLSIESMMPSNRLILCHSLLLLASVFPSIKVFSNEWVLCIRWPKYWSFSFTINPYNEYSGLTSFHIDWFHLLAVPRVFSSTTVRKHYFFRVQLYGPTLTSTHDYWKNHSFDYMYLCQQWSLCFLICCLARRQHLVLG